MSCSRWGTPARPHPATFLFPPPTFHLSLSLLNNSPRGCMRSRPRPALGVIDFFGAPRSGGSGDGDDDDDGDGGRGSWSVCTYTWYFLHGRITPALTDYIAGELQCMLSTVDNHFPYWWWWWWWWGERGLHTHTGSSFVLRLCMSGCKQALVHTHKRTLRL